MVSEPARIDIKKLKHLIVCGFDKDLATPTGEIKVIFSAGEDYSEKYLLAAKAALCHAIDEHVKRIRGAPRGDEFREFKTQ